MQVPNTPQAVDNRCRRLWKRWGLLVELVRRDGRWQDSRGFIHNPSTACGPVPSRFSKVL